MTLDEARTMLDTAICELESGPSRDVLAPLTTGARELLTTTTPADERTAADDLLAVAVALPVLAAGVLLVASASTLLAHPHSTAAALNRDGFFVGWGV